MEILLYDNSTGLGKMYDIVHVDTVTAHKLMSERRAFNAAAPSVRRRFSKQIAERALSKTA